MRTKFRSTMFVYGLSENQVTSCHFSYVAAQLHGSLLFNCFGLLRCWVINLNTIWSTLQTNFMINCCDFDSECYGFCLLQCCVVNLNTIWSMLKRNFIVKFCEFDFHCFLEKKTIRQQLCQHVFIKYTAQARLIMMKTSSCI